MVYITNVNDAGSDILMKIKKKTEKNYLDNGNRMKDGRQKY